MRTLIIAAALCFTMGGGAMGQTTATPNAPPNPVLTHYRAYVAALEANDLATAESEAAAALEASMARDGEGGRTGVLALNLARVRLELQRTEAAQAPALQAFNVATARGAASGVDPLMARLVLGRAELAGANPAPGATRLLLALREASARADLAPDVYDASTSLGVWAFRARRYEMSRETWNLAAQRADGARIDHGFARAQALTAMAASIIMDNARSTRTRPASYDRAAHQPAEDALAEAITILAPMAAIGIESGELTLAQSEYAQARAWRLAMYSRLARRSEPTQASPLTPAGDGGGEPQDIASIGAPARNACPISVTERPHLSYPREALNNGGVGAVVVRLIISESGLVQDVQIAAVVPDSGGFREAVATQANVWRVERRADAPAGCDMAQVIFTSIGFAMDF